MSDYNFRREAQAALKEIAEESMHRAALREQSANKEFKDTRDEILAIKEHNAFLEQSKRNYHHKVLNETLGTAFKAIYISALQKDHELTSRNRVVLVLCFVECRVLPM